MDIAAERSQLIDAIVEGAALGDDQRVGHRAQPLDVRAAPLPAALEWRLVTVSGTIEVGAGVRVGSSPPVDAQAATNAAAARAVMREVSFARIASPFGMASYGFNL